MKVNKEIIEELVKQLSENDMTVIAVEEHESQELYRVVTLGYVLVIVGGEGEPFVQVSPTQFACSTQQGVVSSINQALLIYPMLIKIGFNEIDFNHPVFIVVNREGELLEVVQGDEAKEKISLVSVAQNYDKDKLKSLAENALLEGIKTKTISTASKILKDPFKGIKTKTISTASKILKDPSGNTSKPQLIVKTNGQRLVKGKRRGN